MGSDADGREDEACPFLDREAADGIRIVAGPGLVPESCAPAPGAGRAACAVGRGVAALQASTGGGRSGR